MKKVIGIGGAVIKTGAHESLKKNIDDIEIVMFNGGAIFHDFQLALEGYTSVPIDELNKSLDKIKDSSLYLWDWIENEKPAPEGSLARVCEDKNIPTMLFSCPACDYWAMFKKDKWDLLAKKASKDLETLHNRFQKPFHYINMGSAVIHPEVFLKAIQGLKHNNFRADVVDFLDMYRPRTRVAIYGKYYQMTHKEFMEKEFDKLK
tara:strand:+ start:137 stop:751 length:615 start_codon:yes stop_codon:yes gene_type:complete